MSRSRIFAVAWREFRHTVMRPIFIIAILGIPLLIIGIGVVAVVISTTHKEPPLVGAIAIVDASGEVAEAARIAFRPTEIKADVDRAMEARAEQAMRSGATGFAPDGGTMSFQRGDISITIEAAQDSGEAGLAALKQRLQRGELLAIAVMPGTILEIPPASTDLTEEADQPDGQIPATYDLFVAEGVDSDNVELIENRLGQAVVRVRARRMNLEPRQAIAMLTPPRPSTRSMTEAGVEQQKGEADEIKRQILPMVFMMLIWIGVFSSAQHLMLSTIEEKSNRVMEVLLSAVSPFQLMTGKILGYGAVGLLIVAIYSSLGVAAMIYFATFSDFLTWVDLAMLAIFYLMAYFMIASMMAAVGSAVTDIREANTLVAPVMLILMVPLMLWMPISQDPNGPVATIFSFVPPAIPFAMILRHVAEEPVPAWEYPATIIWGIICAIGMMWLAAKIFRVGVLMYGKPPSLIELIKWVRYS